MRNKIRPRLFYMFCLGLWPMGIEAADPEVLKPRVPLAQIEEASDQTPLFSPFLEFIS